MFDAVPDKVLLLALLVAIGLGPLVYILRHVSALMTVSDITLPPPDRSWRSGNFLLLSISILIAVAGAVVLLLSPNYDGYSHSDFWMPPLLTAFGSYLLGSTVIGWRKGRIQPLIDGVDEEYDRKAQPKRYWASMLWSGSLGITFCASPILIGLGNSTPQCDTSGDQASLTKTVAICNELLNQPELTTEARAELFASRGRVHHSLGNDLEAFKDYSMAIRLDPYDAWSLYNRARVLGRNGQLVQANLDLDDALVLQPDNVEFLHDRALNFLNLEKFPRAIEEFTRINELDPDHDYALANRGAAYTALGQPELAERDFARFKAGDPAWWVVQQNRAWIAMKRNDYAAAIPLLTEAIKDSPDGRFALNLRAFAYHKMGQEDLAKADQQKLPKPNKAIELPVSYIK